MDLVRLGYSFVQHADGVDDGLVLLGFLPGVRAEHFDVPGFSPGAVLFLREHFAVLDLELADARLL